MNTDSSVRLFKNGYSGLEFTWPRFSGFITTNRKDWTGMYVPLPLYYLHRAKLALEIFILGTMLDWKKKW